MGKKKPNKTQIAQKLKDEGNKAFSKGDFAGAIKLYTEAIEISEVQDSGMMCGVYYANRGNALLEMGDYEKCQVDCDMAISLDTNYVKAYYRKAKA